MADNETGAAEQPADLRSVLAAAADEVEAGIERHQETPADDGGADTVPGAASEADKGERKRGPDGKFASKGKTEGNEQPSEAKAEDPAVEIGDKAAEAKPASIQAPQHWSAADKEWLASIPAEHQASVLDRFKKMEAGFTPKLQRLAAIEKDFGPAVELFTPHLDGLRSRNTTPAQVIKAWADVETKLLGHKSSVERGGADAGGAQVVANIIRAYRVNPAEIAALLTNPQQPQTAQRSAVPPELMERLNRLETAETSRLQAANQARLDETQRKIDTFANDKDDGGNLKYPFFAELEPDMMALAQLDMQAGKTPDLADLYDRAVYANRETRTKLLSLTQETEAKRAAAERKAKSEAAQRAAVSTTGSRGNTERPRSGSQNRSLREEIEANAADLDAA